MRHIDQEMQTIDQKMQIIYKLKGNLLPKNMQAFDKKCKSTIKRKIPIILPGLYRELYVIRLKKIISFNAYISILK